MRTLGLLLAICPIALFAQPAESDSRTLQTLLNEVQQLRLAIERSTLLGARTQLAVSQLQLQEEKSARVTQKLTDLRDGMARAAADKAGMQSTLRELETQPTRPEPEASQIQERIKRLKLDIERMTAIEQQRSAQESDLATQAMAAQRELQDSRAWIADMQRLLDAAIQQMLKPR